MTKISEKCVQNIIDSMTLAGIETELRMAERFETSKEYIAELKEAKRRMTQRWDAEPQRIMAKLFSL
jgi:hypothetical protein